jgi:hypothetical protein
VLREVRDHFESKIRVEMWKPLNSGRVLEASKKNSRYRATPISLLPENPTLRLRGISAEVSESEL